MVDLEAARAIASRRPECSGDEDELRLLVFELCDEIENVRRGGYPPAHE